jgi:hypothetical protein
VCMWFVRVVVYMGSNMGSVRGLCACVGMYGVHTGVRCAWMRCEGCEVSCPDVRVTWVVCGVLYVSCEGTGIL